MPWTVTAEPEEFTEAVDWFAQRFPLTEALRAQLGEYAGERAWTIAGVAQLEVVLSVHDSLRAAIEAGTSLDEWKKQIQKKLTDAWGKADAPRLETIFRNATQQSLNAGRWRQMHDPDVLEARPYGLFDSIDDDRRTELCETCHGTVLPLSHSWWATHSPQLHHRCRSSIRNITRRSALRRGVTLDPAAAEPSEGFGRPPTFVGWEPDAADYPPAIWAEFQKKRAKRKVRAASPLRITADFDPSQPRDAVGKWSETGAGGKSKPARDPEVVRQKRQEHFDSSGKRASEFAQNSGHVETIQRFLNAERHAVSRAERDGKPNETSDEMTRFLRAAHKQGHDYKGPVFRGTTPAELEQLRKTGTNIGTWSVSKDPEGSAHFAKKGGVLFVIKKQSGAIAMDHMPESNTFSEALVAKGTHWRIVDERDSGGVKVVSLEAHAGPN